MRIRTPSALFAALTLLLLAAEAGRVLWFASADPAWKSEPVLTCWFPPEIERGDFSGSRAADVLSYDSVELLEFSAPDSESWQMEVIRMIYEPGNRRHLHDIYSHSPEICMPASGATLERSLAPRQLEIDGHQVFVRQVIFQHSVTQDPVHVFKFFWIGGTHDLGLDGPEASFRQIRLKAARARIGHPPAVLILANVIGAKSDDQAWEIFRERVMARARFE